MLIVALKLRDYHVIYQINYLKFEKILQIIQPSTRNKKNQ